MNKDIEALRNALPKLSARSQEFAESLLMQAADRGLTEKQMFWVRKLCEPVADTAKANLGDFSRVLGLFATASDAGLKHPKVRLQLNDGSPIVLAVAGSNSKYAGQINVTDGKPFGSNVWYGRVNSEGQFMLSPKIAANTAACVTALLVNFATNPAGVASAYGHATGNCCFCAKTLTDQRSVSVGYGPICADKYALPWG